MKLRFCNAAYQRLTDFRRPHAPQQAQAKLMLLRRAGHRRAPQQSIDRLANDVKCMAADRKEQQGSSGDLAISPEIIVSSFQQCILSPLESSSI